MKNVSFTAGPKNGGFVNSRISSMHHSSEGRIGLGEVMFAGIIILSLLGFALVILR